MAVQTKLLEILVCPACKGPLSQAHGKDPAAPAPAPDAAPAADAPLVGLDCAHCHLRFPVIDDIPVMLIDQAQRL